MATDFHHNAETDMGNSQLVSIIMPMHNSEQYLRESIESVLAQTYPHWELLIIDDASTDSSTDIVKEYAAKEQRISLLHNEQNIKMPSAPRNVGIMAAKGRYIAFLDSDDVWFPQKLEQQLPMFSDNRVAIVYSNYEKMDEQGRRNDRFIFAPHRATYRTLLCGNIIGNLTGIYDTHKVGKVIIRDIHHEDYAMWLSILKKGFIAKNTGTTLAAYRVRNSSVSSQKLRVCKWQWDVYRKVEHLSIVKSAFYFCCYAFNAFFKSII